MWNKYHMEDFYELADCKLWVIPFIHGSISQLNFQDMNKKCSVLLISRRSRLYAGTRYLKRGINDLGYSANHVETEQILQVHNNQALQNNHPILSSYIQLRASFPFFWSQTPSSLTPKPPIIIDKAKDPRCYSTKKHFARLFQKYSRNIICLNLTKKHNERERPLSVEYDYFVNRNLNKSMPPQLRTIYIHFDVKAN